MFPLRDLRLLFPSRQYLPKTNRETVHRASRIIGWHVWSVRVFVAGGFFQHVCGNSEPVSAA
jgi:hypothetical protein